MAEVKKPFHEMVAENLIAQLKAGTAPWQRPWAAGEPGGMLPVNPTTRKRYKGINAIHLMSQGRSDPRWMTYRQAGAAGAQVRKGERGTPVQYWKFSEEAEKRDAHGRPVLDAEGRPVKETVMLERPRVFFATVFNAEQIEGLPPLAHQPPAWDAVARAEHILKASGALIQHGEPNRAFYRPATDRIHLPDRGQFPSADAYYATALHELGHWSGHASRLGRDLAHPFGSHGYAREELRAEIASMILGDQLGLGHDPGQHAAYVGSWIKALEDDPLEIFRAAAEAEKIKDYVMAFEQQQEQEQGQEQIQEQEASMQPAPQEGTPEVAEAWTLGHLARGTLARALETAHLEQLERVAKVLDAMQPLTPQNPFWSRHALPEAVAALDAQIAAAIEPLEQLRPEARVAAARKAGELEAFEAAASRAFELPPHEPLPPDWNGVVEVQASAEHEVDGEWVVAAAADLGVAPEFWSVYAQRADGGRALVKDLDSPEEAAELAYRLAVVAANAIDNEHERAALLARAHEDRVRHDPDSTDEDVSAAIAARQATELNALRHDAELQPRLAGEKDQPRQAADRPEQEGQTYLAVPFKEKDAAKALGARWDRRAQSWYVPPGADRTPFAKWMQAAAQTTRDDASAAIRETLEQANRLGLDRHARRDHVITSLAFRWGMTPDEVEEVDGVVAVLRQADSGNRAHRVYLAVPYGERAAAKAAGAAWDKAAKSWYAGPHADMERLQRWLPDKVPAQQAPAMSPREEFAEALRAMGCELSGAHPIMDGRTHRIAVDGDRKGEQAGFYVGYLDAHPAGYIKNNRTGVEMKWKAKGYCLDAQEKARLAAEAATKLAERAEEQARLHEASAERVARRLAELVPVTAPTPYLRTKGIGIHAGVFTDEAGRKTCLPAFDADGKQWTMQVIQEDGTKRFARDSRKEGCFHPVGGMEALARAPALVLSEGYATAATLAEALGFATVAAFDAGNLTAVAKALHAQFPDKPVLILGDDDRQLELTQGVNAGRVKAQEAAKAVGGTAIFPIFAPGENVYPADLEPITPQRYRAHLRATKALEEAQQDPEGVKLTDAQTAELKRAQLSEPQRVALERMKAHTDFNDLATRSALGREQGHAQVQAGVGRVIREAEARRTRSKKEEQQHVEERRHSRRAARMA